VGRPRQAGAAAGGAHAAALGFAPPEGIAGLTLDYRLGHADGKLALALDPFSVELANSS
jgi:hypothetical protein